MPEIKFSEKLIERADKLKARPFFGEALEELLAADKDIVLVSADSGRACGYGALREKYPSQVIECGISEQAAIGVAAGLSKWGKKPIFFAFAPFASQRCYEQIKVDIAYPASNVLIVGAEAGVAAGTQGITHYGWEDMAALRALPGMTVMQPADNMELLSLLKFAMESEGPAYMRLSGGKVPQKIYGSPIPVEKECIRVLRTGRDVNILASGFVLAEALKACDILSAKGVDAGIADVCVIKPIDAETVGELAGSGFIVTVEEHSRVGGMGSAVAESLSDSGLSCRLLRLGLPDEYPCRVSNSSVMMRNYGLDGQGIAESVMKVLAK